MAAKNFTTAGLNGLLKIIEASTPENQPSDGVLSTYLNLVKQHEAPDPTEVDILREEIQKLRIGQANMPGVDPTRNRALRERLRRRNYA